MSDQTDDEFLSIAIMKRGKKVYTPGSLLLTDSLFSSCHGFLSVAMLKRGKKVDSPG